MGSCTRHRRRPARQPERALPPSPDAQVPAARGRGNRIEEGALVEITWPNLLIPQKG